MAGLEEKLAEAVRQFPVLSDKKFSRKVSKFALTFPF